MKSLIILIFLSLHISIYAQNRYHVGSPYSSIEDGEAHPNSNFYVPTMVKHIENNISYLFFNPTKIWNKEASTNDWKLEIVIPKKFHFKQSHVTPSHIEYVFSCKKQHIIILANKEHYYQKNTFTETHSSNSEILTEMNNESWGSIKYKMRHGTYDYEILKKRRLICVFTHQNYKIIFVNIKKREKNKYKKLTELFKFY